MPPPAKAFGSTLIPTVPGKSPRSMSPSPRSASPARSPRASDRPATAGAKPRTPRPPISRSDSTDGGTVNRVHVVVRLRPAFVRGETGDSAVKLDETARSITVAPKDEADRGNFRTFYLDGILGPERQQTDAFEQVRENVMSVLDGVSACVMCYGQTGSGKTHTLSNLDAATPENNGVMPRTFQALFDKIEASGDDVKYEVSVQYVQIYMELIQDLLDPELSVSLREDTNGRVFLTGTTNFTVLSVADCLELFNAGMKNRTTAFTSMNAHSSRSHAAYILTVVKHAAGKKQTSSLYMVDLAGSERTSKSEVVGVNFEEAVAINSSLTVLGRVIYSLANPKNKIRPPFRESKLTRMLTNVFTQGAKTTLIVCISMGQDDVAETNSSLEFAKQAMNVKVREVKNEEIDYYALAMQLQAQLDMKTESVQLDVVDRVALDQIAREKYVLERRVTQLEDYIKYQQRQIDAFRKAMTFAANELLSEVGDWTVQTGLPEAMAHT